MSREWKPGTVLTSDDGRVVYAIEVTGNSIAAAQTRQAWEEGACIVESDGNGWLESHFDNLRPLVVIDPEDREAVERLAKDYHESDHIAPWCELHNVTRLAITDALQAALREFANPKPPKPEEPMGLGAVVEDSNGALWVRVGVTIGDLHWRSTEPGNTNCFKWRVIDAVKVLSEGVQ